MAIGIPGQPIVETPTGPVATGQSYAQQIAGGMPMEQVIAPGVSYSPAKPGGYTQADLTPPFYNPGLAPVMPSPPTTDISLTIPDQMPYAPPGTTVDDLIPLDNIQDYLEFVPNLGLPSDIPFQDIAANTSFAPDLSSNGNFFVPNKFDLDVEAILQGVDPEKLAEIDLTNIDLPKQDIQYSRPGIDYFPEPRDPFFVSDFFDLPGSTDAPSQVEPTPIGDIRDTYTPEQVAELERKEIERQAREEANIINKYGSRENLQNQIDAALFTNPVIPTKSINDDLGIYDIRVIPGMTVDRPSPQQSIFAPQMPKQPKIPAVLNSPMNFTSLPQTPVMPQIAYTPPVPSPQIEDIVSPIKAGRLRNFKQPGLFSLV